ncbi:hypothetical protein CDD82_2659 [Ophiocordyceps australis]|uniref:AMP-dependent synthetase/ligase domain-containing protein n=1 Tax=Ophiocordyceps australis TaxID=1399860 RepID=A0A2C5ZRR5_9HYPO|nr:hypothetical protein CDD82_2659 [Ophiocordyceps australis]
MAVLETLDSAVTDLLGQWNVYSTALATLLVALVTYHMVLSGRDPDVHPLLLARQTVPSTVRNPGESPVYRAHGAPHGMPLATGLGVRDPDAPKWSRGRDGDLRDVWRQAVASPAVRGRFLTVHGSQNVVEHKLDDLTRQINIVGRHLVDAGATKVAIYLPNSVELLVALFACSFYTSLTPLLVPFDASNDELVSMLDASAADAIITAPGTFTLEAVVKALPSLRQIIWVVDPGNRHMDWDTAPDSVASSSVKSDTWHDIVANSHALIGTELPPLDPNSQPHDVVTFCRTKAAKGVEVVSFSHANIVAGMAGQISAIPTRERLGHVDLFLPALSLTDIYTLVTTLVAIYSNASVALNSVAGPTVDLELACQGVAPTVIVASSKALAKVHAESMSKLGSPLAKWSHRMATSSLDSEGIFPSTNILSGCAAAARPIPPSRHSFSATCAS